MQLAIPPPNRVSAGIAWKTPLVVTFSASSLVSQDNSSNLSKHNHDDGVSGIWTYLSLWTEDKRHNLVPPDTQLLRGTKTASVQLSVPPAPEDSERQQQQQQQPDKDMYAYVAFPEIAITRPGRYCLMVSLVDLNGGQGKVLKALYSKGFEVVPAGEDCPEHEVDEVLAYLSKNGIEV